MTCDPESLKRSARRAVNNALGRSWPNSSPARNFDNTVKYRDFCGEVRLALGAPPEDTRTLASRSLKPRGLVVKVAMTPHAGRQMAALQQT